jgi:glycosyltransferase involved in cell wall biosynthesis
MTKPLLAATMIVRNEEEMLSRCLQSIFDLVDQILIVDTGSTDRTMEIARDFGADVVEIPWREDFAGHRNEAFDLCKCRWALVIDADEELDQELLNVENVRSIIGALPDDIHGLKLIGRNYNRAGQIMNEWDTVRLFRMGVGARYDRKAHNKPVVPNGFTSTSDLVINHYGYDLSPEKMEAKHIRTTRMLEKELAENPNSFEAHYFLCNHWASRDPAKALGHAKQAQNLYLALHKYRAEAIENMSFIGSLYHTACRCCIMLGNLSQALEWCRTGLSAFPDDLDLNFDLVSLGELFAISMIQEGAVKYLAAIERHKDPSIDHQRTRLTIGEHRQEQVKERLAWVRQRNIG